jgi:hypothetical protein
VKGLPVSLLLSPMLSARVGASESGTDEGMRGCRWSAYWQEIPAPGVGGRARPSLSRKMRKP